MQIPVYHTEVSTWEVYNEEDSLLAILYLDFHPAEGKKRRSMDDKLQGTENAGWTEE